MTETIQVVTPDWLFDRARITSTGVVSWGGTVPERGPGVYIVTSDKPYEGCQVVVYIGRSKHLSRRMSEFYRHKHGHAHLHRGGQDILTRVDRKTVYWGAVQTYRAAEDTMLEAFKAVTGRLPWGNKKSERSRN